MYKLLENEGLYRVSDDKYIVVNMVEIQNDRVVCRHEYDFRDRHIIRDQTFPIGEVGIFWKEDYKDLCNTCLDYCFSIYNFHEKLYDYGFLVDDPMEF